MQKDEQGFHMEQLNSGEIPIKNHLGPLRRQKDQQGFHMKSFEFLQNSGEIPFFLFPAFQINRTGSEACIHTHRKKRKPRQSLNREVHGTASMFFDSDIAITTPRVLIAE